MTNLTVARRRSSCSDDGRGYEWPLGAHHDFALGPDGVDDDGVTGGDEQTRDHEHCGGHHHHVQLPLPGVREVNPTLVLAWSKNSLK